MSDAYSDANRDRDRVEAYGRYLQAVHDFLINQTPANREKVIESAHVVDGIKRGLCGEQTSLTQHIDELLSKLRSRDEEAWAVFLNDLDRGYRRHLGFKALSPFADQFFITNRDHKIDGDLRGLLKALAAEGRAKRFLDGKVFVVNSKPPAGGQPT